MKILLWPKASIAAAVFIITYSSSASRANAIGPPASETRFSILVPWADHLTESSRYGEAADVAQQLVDENPSVPLAYELRGTIEVRVGDFADATHDFKIAFSEAPHDGVSAYGCFLCELRFGKYDTAGRYATDLAIAAPDGFPRTGAVEFAQSVLALARHDFTDLPGPNNRDAPDMVQIASVFDAKLHRLGEQQSLEQALRTQCFSPVLDIDSPRLLCHHANVEVVGAVTDPDLLNLYKRRISFDRRTNSSSGTKHDMVSGVVDLKAAPEHSGGEQYISFLIDGQLLGLVNAAPFSVRWDTRDFSNGPHELVVKVADTNGNVLSERSTQEIVNNENAASTSVPHGDLSDEAYLDAQTRTFNLLELHVARKSLESLLAHCYAISGEKVLYEKHNLRACAMEPITANSKAYLRKTLTAGTIGVNSRPSEIWQGSTSGNRVALTFDDGPSARKTPLLLDALANAHAPATFFVVGSRANESPNVISRMAALGDEVENHSYTHPNLSLCSSETLLSEIVETSVLIHDLTGTFPEFFRPPGGDAGPVVMHYLQYFGLSGGFWTIDVLHEEDEGSPTHLVQYVMKHLHPGAIILMHNGTDVTIAAIPSLVTRLRARGYHLVLMKDIGWSSLKKQHQIKLKE